MVIFLATTGLGVGVTTTTGVGPLLMKAIIGSIFQPKASLSQLQLFR